MIALHIYWNISCDSIVVLLLIQSPLGDDDRGPSIKGVVNGFIGIDVIVVVLMDDESSCMPWCCL